MDDHSQVGDGQGEIKGIRRAIIRFRHSIHTPTVLELEGVGAKTAGECVVSKPTVEDVIPIATIQTVRPLIAPEDIVACISHQCVIVH